MEYSEVAKRKALLRVLDRELRAARERGEGSLWLEFYNAVSGLEASLEVQKSETNVADEAQLGGAEAIGLLKELNASGYIRLQLDRHGFNADAGTVEVTFLDKGRVAIK